MPATGWAAFTYVIMRAPDCDSPMAMTCSAVSPPSTSTSPGRRTAWAACEKMS